MREVENMHRRDLAEGGGFVELPSALARKYPNADREWPWQWVFPATRQYVHESSGLLYRHHLHETVLQRAVRQAVQAAELYEARDVSQPAPQLCHGTARGGIRYPTIQELLGHRDVATTIIYTHVLNRGPFGVRSPLD